MAENFLEQQIHPTVIIAAYRLALDDIVDAARKIRWTLFNCDGNNFVTLQHTG